jgi:hypothetical protein
MGRGSIISVLLYGKREHNLRITVWEEGAQSPYYCMGRGSTISVLLYGKRRNHCDRIWNKMGVGCMGATTMRSIV